MSSFSKLGSKAIAGFLIGSHFQNQLQGPVFTSGLKLISMTMKPGRRSSNFMDFLGQCASACNFCGPDSIFRKQAAPKSKREAALRKLLEEGAVPLVTKNLDSGEEGRVIWRNLFSQFLILPEDKAFFRTSLSIRSQGFNSLFSELEKYLGDSDGSREATKLSLTRARFFRPLPVRREGDDSENHGFDDDFYDFSWFHNRNSKVESDSENFPISTQTLSAKDSAEYRKFLESSKQRVAAFHPKAAAAYQRMLEGTASCKTLFHVAVEKGDVDAVEKLAELDPDVINLSDRCDPRLDDSKLDPLSPVEQFRQLAGIAEQTETVAEQHLWETPLITAIRKENYDMVQLLIDLKVKPDLHKEDAGKWIRMREDRGSDSGYRYYDSLEKPKRTSTSSPHRWTPEIGSVWMYLNQFETKSENVGMDTQFIQAFKSKKP